MRRNCNFNINPAFAAGVTLLWISLLIRNVLELGGPAVAAAHLLSGAACATAPPRPGPCSINSTPSSAGSPAWNKEEPL